MSRPAPTWGASPLVIGRSWSIAAALVRRHPELLVHEMHPAGGMYDVLCIASTSQLSPDAPPSGARVMLNRVGTLQVHRGDSLTVISDWPDAFCRSDPFGLVRELEDAAGWRPPVATPPATERSVTYRFLATALAMLGDDRHQWDVRNEFMDTAGDHERNDWVAGFPMAEANSRSVPVLGIWGEPQSHFWALLRDGQAVALASIEGVLYLPADQRRELIKAYAEHGRRIRGMTAALLKTWL